MARSTLQGGNVTTRQTCAGSQRQSVAHSLPPLWFLVTSPTVSLQLPIIRGVQRRKWNFRKPVWASNTLATERSILLIPVNIISVEELYQRFCGVMQKAASHSIPRGFRPTYTTCLDDECQDLLKHYEDSGNPDIADHLIESLDAARLHRWEELTSKMNFTHSSRKSWALIRRLGAAQQPSKSTYPSVRANAVAAHLNHVFKAPHNKKFERQVRIQGRTLLKQMSDKSFPHLFTEEEILAALKKTKPATAPGYDNIHVEVPMNLGPKARTWLSKFFSRMMATHSVPKIWRKANVIAVEKPRKDPSLAANYRPVSLLSVCHQLLERLALQRISPTVEGLLSPDQAGFRKGRSTCEQVAALTTFIENGFQQNLELFCSSVRQESSSSIH